MGCGAVFKSAVIFVFNDGGRSIGRAAIADDCRFLRVGNGAGLKGGQKRGHKSDQQKTYHAGTAHVLELLRDTSILPHGGGMNHATFKVKRCLMPRSLMHKMIQN